MTSPNSSTSHWSAGVPAGAWFKSSFSYPNGNQCVEVFFDNDLVHIRDSKNRGVGPVLSVPAREWTTFLEEVAGRAPAGSNTVIRVMRHVDGGASLRTHLAHGCTLSYTSAEWAAFVAGVRDGQFELPAATVAA